MHGISNTKTKILDQYLLPDGKTLSSHLSLLTSVVVGAKTMEKLDGL